MRSYRLLRIFDQRKLQTKKVLPRVVAIDGFKGDAGGERFQTVLADVENKEIVEILPDRKVNTEPAKVMESIIKENVILYMMDDLNRKNVRINTKTTGDSLFL